MGLPEPTGEPKPKSKTKKKPTADVPRQSENAAPARPSNPWESAGVELAAKQAEGRTATRTAAQPGAAPPPPSGTPWVPQDERSGAVFARRLGRGLVWFVFILAAVTGVRSWIIPPKAPAPAPAPVQTAAAYPDAEAQAVAARFARAYLSWDESKAAERAALLASVLPAGAETAMGWDGRGRQEVLTVQPGAVKPGADQQARVRVDVLIRAGEAPAGATPAPAAASARWVGLDVPVIEAGGRVVVTGRPGLVGIPATGPKTPALPAVQADPELSMQTETTVGKFFQSFAGGDVESVTAPGAKVPGLPAGITFKGLTSWSVDAGSGRDRSGTAVVAWTLGGAAVEQVYRVKLTQVSSADAQRWQVADVHGGSL
ncbi:conjugal transfer protein [Streptomyces sp. NPDC055254]